MKTVKSTMLTALACAVGLTSVVWAQSGSMDQQLGGDTMVNTVTMIDIHQTTDIAKARAYANWVDDVAARNGVEMHQVYEITDVSEGEFQADAVFLFSAPSPENLGALAQDAEYAERVPERDRTFEMDALVRYAVKPLVPVRDDVTARMKDPAKAEWVTLIDIHNVDDMAAARDYAAWVAGVADRNGVEILQIYEVLETVQGDQRADVVFFFRAPSPEQLGALGADAEYAARVPERDRAFRMDELRRFAVKPIIISGSM